MKIKKAFLAFALNKLNRTIKAELIIDDSNGTSLTFPDISDVSEIVEGVAVTAPDDTYVIADGDRTLTIVVASNVVTTVTIDDPADVEAATEEETQQFLTALVDDNVALKEEVSTLTAKHTKLEADFVALKAALKHDDGKAAAAAAADKKGASTKYKYV